MKSVLTRLEVDGFKNLLNFSIDFGPFNCIAGENGVGKSNIFDAIQFLSLLADNTLMDAALSIRGTDPETADLRELFWTDGVSNMDYFRMAAEMIVEPETEDDFGRPSKASSTYLHYEIQIGYEEPTDNGTLGRLILLSEDLTYITEGQAARRIKFPLSAKNFRSAVVENRRRTPSGYITTNKPEHGETEILLHQEGNQGRPQKAPAKSAPRTTGCYIQHIHYSNYTCGPARDAELASPCPGTVRNEEDGSVLLVSATYGQWRTSTSNAVSSSNRSYR